jgi:hypothetical protein
MAIITAWLVFEFAFIYFMYPETAGRTLEELAFCKLTPMLSFQEPWLNMWDSVRGQGVRRPSYHCCREEDPSRGYESPRFSRRQGRCPGTRGCEVRMSMRIGVWKLWKTGHMWKDLSLGWGWRGRPGCLEKKQRMVEFGAFYLF